MYSYNVVFFQSSVHGRGGTTDGIDPSSGPQLTKKGENNGCYEEKDVPKTDGQAIQQESERKEFPGKTSSS